MPEAVYLIPTREQVESLSVGDFALDCWGRLAEVTQVTYRDVDVNGRLFVGYYTRSLAGGEVSQSIKEGRLVRTLAVCCIHTSAELDAIERRLLKGSK